MYDRVLKIFILDGEFNMFLFHACWKFTCLHNIMSSDSVILYIIVSMLSRYNFRG
jgi:hypothetical protein